MKDLKLLTYCNLFPADVNREGAFILCLLYLSQPFHRSALALLLKPLAGDKEAKELLRGLTESGYLYSATTGQGPFYAITAKTARYLDTELEIRHYRHQKIMERNLLTYRLQSFIIARSLFMRAATVCAHLGHFPRKREEKSAVLASMFQAIEANTIPFVVGYNETIYASSPHALFSAMKTYESVEAHINKVAGQCSAARVKSKTDPKEADSYKAAYDNMQEAIARRNKIALRTQVWTHTQGPKVLTLSILEQNGIFLKGFGKGRMSFGILDNTPFGLSQSRLANRLDYAVSLAEALGLEPSITIYTMPDYKPLTERRYKKLDLSFSVPSVTFHAVPKNISRPRSDYWDMISRKINTEG